MLVLPKYQKWFSAEDLTNPALVMLRKTGWRSNWDGSSVSVWPSSIDAGVRVNFQSWSATCDFTSSFDLIETVFCFFLTELCSKKQFGFIPTAALQHLWGRRLLNFQTRGWLLWRRCWCERPLSGRKLECSIFSTPVLPSIQKRHLSNDLFLPVVTCQSTSSCVLKTFSYQPHSVCPKNMKSCSFHQSKNECISDFS